MSRVQAKPDTEPPAQSMKSVFEVDRHSLCFSSLSKQLKKDKTPANTKAFKCPKHTNQTKESLNRTSPFENAASREHKTTLSARAFVPLPVTWRCLSSDSVKRNHQSTRHYVCKCKTVQEISVSPLAISFRHFSFVVTPPQEAQSTSKSMPQLFKSSFLSYLDYKHHRIAQKGFFPFLTSILAVTFISYFLESLLSMLSQLLRKQN